MSLTQNVLADRLRAARENRNMSQQAVADLMSMPRTAITQIEAGNRAVNTIELIRFAELYRLTVSDLASSGSVQLETDPLVALYRIAPKLEADPRIQNEVNRCLQIYETGVDLQKRLGRSLRSGPPAYSTNTPATAAEAAQQGAGIADQERLRLGIGHMPIPDIAELINGQGIWAASASLPDEMSGLFLRHSSIGMVILVNQGHPQGRKRFSYAHEYAHALLDRDRSATVSTSVNSVELIETRANSFAAAFLMPTQGVLDFMQSIDKGQPSRDKHMVFDVASDRALDVETRHAPGTQAISCQDIALLAHHFGVSYQAATYRLRSLAVISGPECTKLIAQDSAGQQYLDFLDAFGSTQGDGKKSPQNRELLTEVMHLAIEAYRQDKISKNRLREIGSLLTLDDKVLVKFADAAKGQE